MQNLHKNWYIRVSYVTGSTILILFFPLLSNYVTWLVHKPRNKKKYWPNPEVKNGVSLSGVSFPMPHLQLIICTEHLNCNC